MKGWIIAGIILLVLFIIWVLIRIDWRGGSDDGFMTNLIKKADQCCLGRIFRRR